MKKKFLSLALCLTLCATNLPVVNAHASDNSTNNNNVSNNSSNKKKRYIIMFKEKPVSVTVKNYNKQAKALEKEAFKIQNKSIKKIESITHTKHKNQNTFLVNACSIDATYEQIKKIEKMDNVEKCYEAHAYKTTMQHAINMCNVKDAWKDTNLPVDGEGTIISIIDTGVDYTHMDMRLDSSSTKTKFTTDQMKSKIKTLGHGTYINQKVPFAYNYAERKAADPHNIHYHGSHVAGISAANTEDLEEGVTGVAYNAQILSMQVFPSSGESALTDDIVSAIEDSVKLGADVINMSLGSDAGFTNHDDLESKAVAAAYNSGCIVATASGNASLSASNGFTYNNPFNLTDVGIVSSPGSNSKSLTVAACSVPYEDDEEIEMCSFSSWGPTPELELKPEITAPGGFMVSLAPNNDYKISQGTSMATPYVSGVSALVKEAVSKKKLSVSNSKLSDYIKYTLINTATPLMDYTYQNGENPYSVRQQGSGLVNAKAAIDNTVIATYNNDATIELGNIKEGTNSIPISIKLTNYGKSDKTYTLKNCPLYTDKCIPSYTSFSYLEGDYYIEKISGSYVKFAAGSVTVKAGSSANINATVVLSNNVKTNHYIEGFIKLENTISLNLPLLGFYGDWDSLPIFDSPNGDSGCYMDKYKYGGSTYFTNQNDEILGLYDGVLALKKSAISLDPNAKNNIAIPYLTRLRNADDVDVSIYDDYGNLIQDLGHFDDLRKNPFSSASEAEAEPICSNGSNYVSWNGKKYNEQIGKYENVLDGQYYFNIKARINKNAKYQNYKLPIYVDSEKPEATIQYSYSALRDELYLDVAATDNFAVYPEVKFNIVVDNYISQISTNLLTEYKQLANGYKRYTVKYVDQKPTYIDVTYSDYAKNTCKTLVLGNSFINVPKSSEESDELGPVVDLSSSTNLINTHYIHSYDTTYTYLAEIKDDSKNVDLIIKLDDESGLSSNKPLTFETGIKTPTEYGSTTKYVEHDIEKIDNKTYKVSLSPEDINSTWELVDYEYDNYYIGTLTATDSNGLETTVDFEIYKSGNDPADNSINLLYDTEYVAPNVYPGYTLRKSDLNADGTYTLRFDVIGLPIAMAKVNGKRATLEHDKKYRYMNDPTKVIHVKVNIPIQEGKNYYNIKLYSDFDNDSLIHDKTYGPIFYNGSGVTFTINTKTPLKKGVYQSTNENFKFNLNIKSKYDAVSISLNGSTVNDYNDIVQSKNGTITKSLTYKIKGDYTNYLNITVKDYCGNTTTKTIKVINKSLDSTQSIKKCKVKIATKQTYTGRKIKPFVMLFKGKSKLKRNTDYKVKYKNNRKIGTAKVIITGIKRYKGKINKTFKIVPGKCKIKKVSNSSKGKNIKLKKNKGGVKYEYFYSTKKKGKYKKLGTSKKPGLFTRKLKGYKKYFIKVRAYKIVKKKKYVGKFSKAVKR